MRIEKLGRAVWLMFQTCNNAGITKRQKMWLLKMTGAEDLNGLEINLEWCLNIQNEEPVLNPFLLSRCTWYHVLCCWTSNGEDGRRKNYAVSKLVLIGFTLENQYSVKLRRWQWLWRSCDNAIAPGFIESDMTDAIHPVFRTGSYVNWKDSWIQRIRVPEHLLVYQAEEVQGSWNYSGRI